MVNPIPEQIDPFELARHGKSVTGEFMVADMDRLVASLDDSTGSVTFNLDFRKKEDGMVATGKIRTEVKMICQRCLNQIPVLVQGEVYLEFVVGAETEGHLESEGYETVSVINGSLVLQDLVEDEVLLALPFSPMHNVGECPADTIVEKLQEQGRPNPFAVLSSLKNKQE